VRLDRLVTQETVFEPASTRRGVSISAVQYSESILIPGVAKRMRHEAPGARLEIRIPSYGHTLDALERGEIDIRIAWGQGKAPSSLRSVPLFTDRIVCVTDRPHEHRASPLTTREYLSASHLRVQGAERTTTGQVVDSAVSQHGTSLNIAMLLQSYIAIPDAIAGTDLIATMPFRIAHGLATHTSLEITPVPLRLPAVRMMGYWHERSHADPGHRWLRGLLIASGRELLPKSILPDMPSYE
jgi:DNA-binding transcriptional LysR family regulator